MPLLSNRPKVIRGVLSFLALCAVLGFVTGLRGALPTAVYEEEGPVATTPSGVVVEAAPTIEAPIVPDEEALEDEEAAEEEEEKAEEAPAPAPTPQPKAPEPVIAPPEEAPPPDPVGDLIEQQPTGIPPPTNLY